MLVMCTTQVSSRPHTLCAPRQYPAPVSNTGSRICKLMGLSYVTVPRIHTGCLWDMGYLRSTRCGLQAYHENPVL